MTVPPRRPGMRAAMRRLAFGLSTLLGFAPRGFFIPYRYAATVEPGGYPGLEPAFMAAEPGFRRLVAIGESYSADLLRILGGPGLARFDQHWFPRLDAAMAYVTVRHGRPRRIVEIGSGHSTRFLVRAVEDGDLSTEIVAVDPAPRAALTGLPVRHVPALLGQADPALFDALEPGDILFVDSSHIAMPGTDVDRLVGTILPRLPAGVLVHLHDILLPDPYPADWAWRGYNEATVVAALILGRAFEIVFSSHWVASRHSGWLAAGIVGQLPLSPGARETSLWLRTL